MNKLPTTGSKRNYGLEALRMAAALYVVTHHSIAWGGLHGPQQPGTIPFLVFSFISAWDFCAPDIFILISGYAGFQEKERKYDYSKIIGLWLEVVLYSVLLSFIYVLIKPEKVAARDIWDMLFPLTDHLYWFFSGYTGLFLVRPILDAAVRKTEKEQLKKIMAVIFLMFSVYGLIADPFSLERGFTFVWMVILYLFGAAMKKLEIGKDMSWRKAAAGIILCTFFTWAWENFGPEFVFVNRRYTGDIFNTYTSPTVLGAGIFHMILFSRFRFPEKVKNIIAFLAPGAFTVYILNTHRLVWALSLKDCFAEWAKRPLWAVPKVVLFSALFALAAMLIDNQRRRLFRSLKVSQSLYELCYCPRRMDAVLRLADLCYIIAFILIWSVMFWKCQYGYCNVDESLYISIPYHFFKWKDGLFIHEWHVLQMSSVLMLPLFKLYFTFIHDTVGILLNFRLIYTFLWGCAAIFFYYRLRKLSNIGAILASLTFLMYAPFDMPALSYNSMGVLMLANACIITLTAKRYRKAQYFLSGIFLACAVLCCPYLLILYGIFSLAALMLRKRDPGLTGIWLYISMGAFLVLVIFLIFVLSRADIHSILQNIPIILDDPEHPDHGFFYKTGQYFIEIFKSAKSAPFVLAGAFAAMLISLVWKKAKGWCFTAICILAGIWLLEFVRGYRDINCVMVPVTLIGLYCLPHIRDRKARRIALLLWLPGVIYSYCQNFTSNQGFYAMANAMTLSAMASAFLISVFVKDQVSLPVPRWSGAVLIGAAALFFAVHLGGELFLRYNCIAYENGLDEQISRAHTGSQKGIRMTPANLEYYNSLLEETALMKEDPGIQKVLFLINNPCLYLDTDKEYGTYSSWMGWISEWTIDRLDRFYELNPDKVPDAVYIPVKNERFIPHFEAMGFSAGRTEKGNFILRKSEE